MSTDFPEIFHCLQIEVILILFLFQNLNFNENYIKEYTYQVLKHIVNILAEISFCLQGVSNLELLHTHYNTGKLE